MRSIGVLRKVCGVEQGVLAERAGISRRHLHEIETGASFGSRRTIKAIDDAMMAILVERLGAAARREREAALSAEVAPSRRWEQTDEPAAAHQVGAAPPAPPPEPHAKEGSGTVQG